MTNEIKIDKNIPLPKTRVPANAYPFDTLKVGESFLIPGKIAYNVASYASVAKKRFPGKDFTCRTVAGGARIWRIK